MSTRYIIVNKNDKDAIDNNNNNQIIIVNQKLTYLMPSINHSYYSTKGLFEANLIEWSKQFCDKNSLFLDIGAHTGSYAISLASYSKKVIAFEPQRMTFYALCGGVALSGAENIFCEQYGLGSDEQVGEVDLKIVSKDGGGSSIHATQNIIGTEKIKIKTLDSLDIRDKISFIKMDIEDNELYALRGGIKTIKRNKPTLLFESNKENKSLFDFIEKKLNYNITRINGYNNMFIASVNKDNKFNYDVKVILLERDSDRVKHYQEHILKNIPSSEIFKAVDSKTNKIEELLKEYNIKLSKNFTRVTRGHLGCALSHISLWKEMIDMNIQNRLILEDDAKIPDNFNEEINKIIEELPSDYDFLYLFVHPNNFITVNDKSKYYLPGKKHIVKAYKTWGMVGYMISLNGAKLLVNSFQNINLSLDDQISTLIHSMKSFAVKNHFIGTIGQLTGMPDKNLRSNIHRSEIFKIDTRYN